MNQHVIKLVTLVMCLLLSQFGFSGNDKIMNYLNGPAIAVNSSISIADQQHIGVYTPPVTPSVINSYIIATLRYEESLLPLFQVGSNSINDEFQLEVTYDIVLTTSTYTSITLTNQKLTIDYNIDGTATYNDISILRYKGYMEADLTITGISFTETGNPSISITDIPEDIYLELASEVERYYPLTPVVANTVEHDYISTKNELLLTWSYALGAESFDLEWIFVDITKAGATQTSLETLINSSSQTYDWKDATRINTTNNYYPVSLAYPSGIIIYRVRPVGIDLVNGNKDLIIADDWTDLGTSTVVSSAWNGGNGNGYVYLGLDSNKNWTYNVAYAEEGKRKEGISYFDGSAKTRQSVTVLNTDQNAIVSETLYDFEGRPAVGFLPTPVPSEGIGFYDDGTGDPFNGGYSKNNFDTDDHFELPVVGPDDMSAFTTSLTNKYYSSNSTSSSLYKDYTAHANDFPFSRTTYKRDGTDRITEQTSVGDILQHGTNNTTKYYYGTPADQELERLFGNEVGPASFYQKNMVKDPNGQVNVTYLDKEGRTIATALAGATPDNLLEIDYRPEPVTIVRDLMQNNIVNGDASTTSSVLTIPANSTSVDIYYQLDYKEFEAACLNNFLDPSISPFACTYTLAITVLDEDGADLVAPLLVSIPSPLTNTVSPHISFTIGPLDIGTYTINKTLKVDQQKTQEYLQMFEDSIRKYYNHEDQNCVPFSPPDSVTCDNSCESFCKEAFREFSHIDQPSGDSIFVYYDAEGNNINPATQTAYVEADYDDFVEQCITECNESETATTTPANTCALKLEMMKSHMSPGGQYFDNLKTKYQDVDPADGLLDLDANGEPMINDGIAPSTFTYDINEWLEDEVATTAPTAIFGNNPSTSSPYTWDEIRALWYQEPWATAVPNADWLDDFVIAYHPEYCAYKYNCIDSIVVHETTCYYDLTSPRCTIPRPYISDYDYYMMMGATMASAEKQKNITGGTNPDFMDFLNPLGLLLSATTTTSSGWNADNSTYMDAISAASASDDPNTNSDFLIDPLFNTDLCNSNNLPLRFIDDGGTCVVKASDWILDKLQNFIAIDATPNYHSIWYVMADPDNIASQTSLPTGMEQAVFDLYNTIHGNVNFPARGEGILDKTGADATKQNKYQFFRSVYKFYRDYILYKEFRDNPNACGNIGDGSAHYYTYWNGDVVNGSDPNVDLDYTSYNSTRDQSYNGNNDLFELLWARNFIYDTYDSSPSSTASPSFTTASQATCNDDCENSASIWLTQLEDCIDALSLSQQDEDDLREDLETDFIAVCQLGCTLTPPIGSSDGDEGTTAILAADDGTTSLYDFQDIIDHYFTSPTCNTTIIYPDTIPNPATPSAAAECNCQQLLDYADSLSISPTNYSALATALNSDLSTSYIADDVERWSDFCNNQLGDIIDFPATLECIDCKCENLAFFITSRYPAYNPYNLTTGASGEAADVATTLNNEFGTSYDHADITAMMNQCIAGDNDRPFNHVLNANFTDLPDLFRCNATLEITDQEDDCAAELNYDIWFAYMNLWEQTLADSIAAFENNYIATCMEDIAGTNTRETFTATYELNEYMYTLYYYDQAGTLIKTVPPEGVKPHSTTDAAFYTAIKNHRIDPVTYPHKNVEHTLVTQYKYDSYNNLIWQSTPDGGETNHWYDKLGRQLLSQNAKQAAAGDVYSYTLYDELGRIYEVGEIDAATTIDDEIEDYSGAFLTWIAAGDRYQVTKTFYDEPINNDVNGYFTNGGQQELRTRVSSITREEVMDVDGSGDPIDDTYDYAVHFSYDIHGNVKEIFQENNYLHLTPPLNLKRITYEYDLVSGNVNKVNYQPEKSDQYYHRYFYDADNRITHTQTSRDNFIWDTDAKYFYYEHGPLARTEIGEKQVAGSDYAYTLQGWIKGVNSNSLNANFDMGKDANLVIEGLNSHFATDAYGYSLGYFEEDYAAVTTNFLAATGTNFNIASPSLYNGNIRHMVTNMLDTDEDNEGVSLNGVAYRYDQVNRIRKSNVFTTSLTANDFGTVSDQGHYKTEHHYDLNGNITQLNRYNNVGVWMDSLNYQYNNDGNGLYQSNGGAFTPGYDYRDGTFTGAPSVSNANKNQLTRVLDGKGVVNTTDFGTGGMLPQDFEYDEIGQLTKDLDEHIDTILWDVYGKVKEIRYYDASNLTRPDILFRYDPSGNRIAKILKTKEADGSIKTANHWEYYYYVRDAQGNIMAVYQQDITHLSGNQYQSTLTLLERNIYGSSRLGTNNQQVVSISNFIATFTTSGGTVAAGTPSYSTNSVVEVSGGGNVTISESDPTMSLHLTIQALDNDVTLFAQNINVISGSLSYSPEGMLMLPAHQQAEITCGYELELMNGGTPVNIQPMNSNTLTYTAANTINITPLFNFNKKQRTIGKKVYEKSNHLGNVLVTLSDRKLPQLTSDKLIRNTHFNDFSAYNSAGAGSYDNFWAGNRGGELTHDNDGRIGVHRKNSGTDDVFAIRGQYATTIGAQYKMIIDFDTDGNHNSVFARAISVSPTVVIATTSINLATGNQLELTYTATTTSTILQIFGQSADITKHFYINNIQILKLDAGEGYYNPDVLSYSDYYPGGFPLPGRHTVQTSSGYDANGNRVYRYGYQGSEKDFEIANVTGAHITTFFREFDTRLNRTWSIDPVFQPWQSPYTSMDNNPILYNDPLGNEVPVSGKKEDQKTLVSQVNEATGGKYRINRKGQLKAKFGNYGKTVVGGLFKQAIKTDNEIPIKAVSNDDETFFDSYVNTTVDVGDIGKGNETFKKGIYAHFMAERLAAGARYSDKSTRVSDMKSTRFGGITLQPKFANYHDEGLKYESLAIGESLGIPKLAIRTDKEITNTIMLGMKSVTGFSFSYGNEVQYNISIPEKVMWLGMYSQQTLMKTPVTSVIQTK
ncbi:MAG: hypothetical protein COA31_002345 [Flavobacteriales bacterium]|nr:hypothetical protein [Flavobacteriales bacterium]